jgi:hypothetical protein
MIEKIDGSPFSQITPWTPHYSFLAMTELVETAGAVCVQGRISQLNQKGCYVNSATTVPVDTPLQIFISRDEETFVTRGKVIYVQEGFGMGHCVRRFNGRPSGNV